MIYLKNMFTCNNVYIYIVTSPLISYQLNNEHIENDINTTFLLASDNLSNNFSVYIEQYANILF